MDDHQSTIKGLYLICIYLHLYLFKYIDIVRTPISVKDDDPSSTFKQTSTCFCFWHWSRGDAYEILNDPDKKILYDTGHVGVGFPVTPGVKNFDVFPCSQDIFGFWGT